MNHMAISEQIQKDMTDAMRARDETRLSALRMVKAALKNREVEKRAALEDKDTIQVLNTLLKQRKDSVEQFTRGNRPELAKKEADQRRVGIRGLPVPAVVTRRLRGLLEAAGDLCGRFLRPLCRWCPNGHGELRLPAAGEESGSSRASPATASSPGAA